MINTEKLCMGCMNDNGGERICPVCGYDSETKCNPNFLQTRFVLRDRYLVGRAIRTNGEGIIYIAWDNAEDKIVKVKEYFPSNFAHRNPDKTVSIVNGGEYKFNEGLMEFIEINRTVMESALPALLPVDNVFEENGTVYAVIPNIPSITLEEFLIKNGGTLKWEQARALFLPLIDTLADMDNKLIIHTGISADTILVGRDGKLRIADYAVKGLRLENSGFKNDMVDGYAAIEQYGFDNLHTDKYTDVYGLCATLFRVLIGNVPPKATLRTTNDSMSIPAHFAEELPRHVLAALANGLQVYPADRTKDLEAFKNELVYGEINAVTSTKKRKTDDDKNGNDKPVKKSNSAKYAIISAACTVLVFAVIALILVFGVFKKNIFGNDDAMPSTDISSEAAPKVDKIGDIDSGAEVTAKLYEVPDLKGKKYSEIIEDDNYEMFQFSISSKVYSTDIPAGAVCSQSIAPGGNGVERNTKIELVLSLGAQNVGIANLKGRTKDEAVIELLKQGFLYDNIDVQEKYDEDAKPDVVIDQSPKAGEKVDINTAVTVYINTYKGEDEGQD